MKKTKALLSGGDLRSIGKSDLVVQQTNNQAEFDELFELLEKGSRLESMRAADAIEKISRNNPSYLFKHKKKIIALSKNELQKELKWHIALLLPRLKLNYKELGEVWQTLTEWTLDKKNSKIVRVNSLQSLFELLQIEKSLEIDLVQTMNLVGSEQIPSINARIRILTKKM